MNPELSSETMGKRESGASTGTAGSHPVSQPVSATTSTPVEQPNYAVGQLLPFPIEEMPSAALGAAGVEDRHAHRKVSRRKESGRYEGTGKIKSTSSRKSTSTRSWSRSARLANDGVGATENAATALPDQRREEPRSKRRAKKLDGTTAAEGNKGVPGGASQPTAVSGDQKGSQGATPLTTAAQRTNRDGELSATKDTGMSGSSTCGTSAYPTPLPSAPLTASRGEQTAAFKVSHIPSSQVLKHYRGQQSGLGTLEAESSRPVMVPMNKNPDSETHQSKKVGVTIFFLGTVLIPLLAFTFLFLSSNKGSPPSSFPVCSSDGCLSLAAALSAKRNRSLDPCEDFGMYVCAAWKPKYSGLASTTMEQTILDSILNQSPPNMSDYIKDLPLRRRPEQFMALCDSARPTSDVPAIRALKEFMRAELSFLMPPDVQVLPSNTSVYAQLLKALVVLSGKWLVPLWFRVDMTGRSGELHVGLSAEPLTELWHRVQNSFNQAHYQRYVELFIEVIYGNGSVSGGASESYLRFLRSRSAYVQANVFKQMSAPIRERHPLPVNGRISDLSYFVPMFSVEDWTSALAAAHDTMVHESAALYVSSRGLLDAMKTVLGSFSSLELLYHTTWWFLEQIGTFTSNRLYAAATATLGAQGRLYLKVMCAAQVSITYNALVADNFWEHRPGADLDAVKRTLGTLEDAVRNATRTSATLELPVRTALLYMLGKMRHIVWPEAPLDFQSGLLLLYGDKVDNKRGFFGHWLSSHRTIQGSYGRSWYKAASLVYSLDTSSPSTYSPGHGVISLATAIAEPPLFYSLSTPAMLFGGLGFAYALGLLLAMDITALLNAAALGDLLVAHDQDHLAEMMACSDSNEKYDAFPFLPALEATHTAYVKSVRGTEQPRLKGMEQFTGEQVFFMTMCLSLCQEDGPRRSSPPCNAAVRNFAPFATAFNCSRRSAMNPAKKCHLLAGQ